MKNSAIATALLVGITMSATIPAAVFAHGGATGVVKERMDAMGRMGKASKALKQIMQGKVAYDADVVREQAAIIKDHAGDVLTKAFPEGSLMAPTEAKPEIWKDWDRFVSLSSQLETLAEGLGLAADNGLMAGEKSSAGMGAMMGGKAPMGAMMGSGQATMMGSDHMGSDHMGPDKLAKMPADGVFTMMVQTCSACHTAFRAEKK